MNNKTGQTLQNFANILFYVTVILFIIVGLSYWVILAGALRGGLGFLLCILVIGTGVFIAYIYKILMTGFGEIVEHQSEHTDLLRKMIKLLQHDTIDQSSATQAAIGMTVQSDNENKQTAFNSQSEPAKKTAEFESRSVQHIICPVCGKTQMSNRNSCYSCGCIFVYKDE